jgi:hypothetical protein
LVDGVTTSLGLAALALALPRTPESDSPSAAAQRATRATFVVFILPPLSDPIFLTVATKLPPNG